MQKNLNSKNCDGGATVGGETYTRETYNGTLSSGDEEHGLVNVELEDKPNIGLDASSVIPSWEGFIKEPALNGSRGESASIDGRSKGSNPGEKDDLSVLGNEIHTDNFSDLLCSRKHHINKP